MLTSRVLYQLSFPTAVNEGSLHLPRKVKWDTEEGRCLRLIWGEVNVQTRCK